MSGTPVDDPATPHDAADAALGHLRVLDFSRVLAGPLATMVLADLGADVIKVERPGAGDDTRAWGPPFDARGRASYFEAVNRNKRSVALDLRDPEDLGLARSLAREADVLVENFRPGVMDRLGLGYEELRSLNPGLIYASVTGFGAGKGASLPGYDLLVQAVGGLMSITGSPDGEPQKVGVALVDVIAGLFCATGILAAVEHRNRSGRGQRLEINLLSSLLAALVNQASAYTVAGVVPRRMGNAHPSIAPYEPYPTGEGELVLAVGNDRQFAELCRVIGVDLAEDERFATNAARVEHRDELRAELVKALAAKPAREWAERLNAVGVPAGEIKDIAAAFEFADSLGLEPMVTLRDEEGNPVRLPSNPIRLSETPPRYRSAPPALPQRGESVAWRER
jgi:crotonobetainyl-CoA:carnitine CoA-transferase CaiB-like acyl-CoA transferase